MFQASRHQGFMVHNYGKSSSMGRESGTEIVSVPDPRMWEEGLVNLHMHELFMGYADVTGFLSDN